MRLMGKLSTELDEVIVEIIFPQIGIIVDLDKPIIVIQISSGVCEKSYHTKQIRNEITYLNRKSQT